MIRGCIPPQSCVTWDESLSAYNLLEWAQKVLSQFQKIYERLFWYYVYALWVFGLVSGFLFIQVLHKYKNDKTIPDG